jgi:hypothetical protein
MHAKKVSDKLLANICAWMHAARRNVLSVAVLATIESRRLSVTGLGRAIDSDAKEKHCIKRADRLIGNAHLYREFRKVYTSFARLIVSFAQRPVIVVDWSDLDSYQRHFLLRASAVVDGRALTLYEEVHCLEDKEKPKTHRIFLKQLKSMLPEGCRPIVVTDAGFRNPWFREIEQLEWDWVGRIRHGTLVRSNEDESWFNCKVLYEQATSTPTYLGQMELARSSPLRCHFVLYKGKPKGRSKITYHGERARSKHSEQCAKREREPWLLATSLPATSTLAKQIVKLYRTRMQIEESFRDVKSVRFGIGFELNLTRSANRSQILLLVAMIATFVLWLLGMTARHSNRHLHYQANTIKDRHVLSTIYLGMRVANDQRFKFQLKELNTAVIILNQVVSTHGEDW